MWLPPYLGDYETLLKALLQNPFLGSGRGGPPPTHRHTMHGEALEPQPSPWHAFASSAAAFLVSPSVRR
jgi:hypothetical protein